MFEFSTQMFDTLTKIPDILNKMFKNEKKNPGFNQNFLNFDQNVRNFDQKVGDVLQNV